MGLHLQVPYSGKFSQDTKCCIFRKEVEHAKIKIAKFYLVVNV